MPLLAYNKGQDVRAALLLLVLQTGSACVLGFAGIVVAGTQDTTPHSAVVTVTSDPPGAMIWKKEGRDYTCTKNVTPGTVELIFRGKDDVQKLRLSRFGYESASLIVNAADQRVAATLAKRSLFHEPEGDAPSDLRQLSTRAKKEFEEAVDAGSDAFLCGPFEFVDISVREQNGTRFLGVAIALERSFGGPDFRLASRLRNAQERRQRMARAVLEGAVAEILARFRVVAAKLPELKDIFVSASYTTTESALDSEPQYFTRVYTQHYSTYRVDTYVRHREDKSIVVDQTVLKALTFSMPVARIPATLDKKAVSEAVWGSARIDFIGN